MKYVLIVFFIIIVSGLINVYIKNLVPKKPIISWCYTLYFNKNMLFLLFLMITTQGLLINKYGFNHKYIIYSSLLVLLITISMVDYKTKTIPNTLISIGIILGIISMLINKDLTVASSIFAALIISGMLAGVSIITKGALGMGDVKVFIFIGLFLGLQSTISVLMFSTFLSGMLSLILLAFRIVNRKTAIPFAPFVFVSTLLAILL